MTDTPSDKTAQSKTRAHTPLPWKFDGEYFKHNNAAIITGGPKHEFVAGALDFNRFDREAEVEANANLIVRAVNAHDDLLAALANVRAALNCHYDSAVIEAVYGAQIDAALVKAQGAL